MKKALVMTMAACALVATTFAETTSLADARGGIGDALQSPDKITETMKKLSPADQKEYLASINEAIKALPGSNESKTAMFLNANKAALKGAAKGNLTTLLAEVFATVPPESLTVLNERFAADLFSRSADPKASISDENFKKTALSVMEAVNKRTSTLDNGAALSTFAILMMVRASGGSPADLQESLIATLPEEAQNKARNEWIPAALGEKQAKNYEPLLGGAGAFGTMPNNNVVMRYAGPQLLESMLGDIVEGTPFLITEQMPERHATPERERDNTVIPPSEPIGYQGQTL